jgi:membrane associated rhomboid family serine protease
VTLAVVVLSVALFFVVALLDLLDIVGWPRALSTLGLSWVGLASRGRVFQLVSSPLLHADLTHLAFNMLTLWMLGPGVEQALGRRRYVIFSAVCATSAMVGFLLWHAGSALVACGYSGVVFGILVAQATLFPERVLYIYAVLPLKMRHAALLLCAVELYLTVIREASGVSHIGHVFGALAGAGYLHGARWQASLWASARRVWLRKRGAPGAARRGNIPWEL